jgi:cytoskeletal protein RodZ
MRILLHTIPLLTLLLLLTLQLLLSLLLLTHHCYNNQQEPKKEAHPLAVLDKEKPSPFVGDVWKKVS